MKVRQIIINVINSAQEWWLRRRQSTRMLPRHLWNSFQNFNKYGSTQAAALAYYAVFSIFPLLLLLAVAVNSVLGPTVGQEQIAQGLKIFLPQQTVIILQENLLEALQQGNTFQLLAVVGLIWSALGLFSNLSRSLDIIFQVPSSRSMWRQRLLAFLMTLILIALVVSSFITSGVMRLFGAFFLDRPSVWITIGTFFLPFGINLVIFILLFRFVPARHVNWDAVWPAAIFGAVGWELAKAGFAWYLDNLANFQVIYGSIGAAIILLFSAYIVASIVLISAELCAQLNTWIIEHPQRKHIYITTETVKALPPHSSPFVE
jgi:membrane protein